MADRAVLEASSRQIFGKRVKRLRRQGRIPATVYGHDVRPESIEVDARAFRVVHGSAGDNQLIDLVLDGKRARPVLIHSTQVDPRRNTALHVEFYQANLRQKLTAHIPIHLVGEAPAVRQGLLALSVLDSVELECLPTDLPPFIEVDVSGLEEVGAAIHVGDLRIDEEKCELKTPRDEVIVHIVAPQVRAEEEEEVAPAAEAEEEGATAPEATPAEETGSEAES